MDTYGEIKKILEDGGKCLLIENGKPIGIVLTMEEYEKLQNKSSKKIQSESERLLIPEINSEPVNLENPIGAAMVEEINFPGVSAELADIALADDITLEDLGIDPDIQLPKDF